MCDCLRYLKDPQESQEAFVNASTTVVCNSETKYFDVKSLPFESF